MNKQTRIPRYAREGALGILKRDIQLALLELKGGRMVKDFRFINERFMDSINQISCLLVLNTERGQEVSLIFSFLERTSEDAIICKSVALSENLIINKTIATYFDIKNIVHRIVAGRFKGFSTEDVVLRVVADFIKNNPNGVLRHIRHGESFEDKQGKDFIFKANIQGDDFEFSIDIKSPSSFFLAKKTERLKKKKGKRQYNLMKVEKEEVVKDPEKFVQRVIHRAFSFYYLNFKKKKK